MSHYTKCKTKINDKAALIQALHDLGFEETLQVHDTAVQLEGYQGDKRADVAEIILPRRKVGHASNDIGFKLQEDGTWGAIISDYDKTNSSGVRSKSEHTKSMKGYNDDWLDKLSQRYTYHKIKDELSLQGFTVEEETEENGEIFLSCSSFFGGG